MAIQNIQDGITKLYKSLAADGYENLGTEQEFRTRLQDPSSVDKLYESLTADGYENLGTREEFGNRLVPAKPAGDAAGTEVVEPTGAEAGTDVVPQPVDLSDGGQEVDAAMNAITQNGQATPVNWRDEQLAFNTDTDAAPAVRKKGEVFDDLYNNFLKAYKSSRTGGQSAYGNTLDYAIGMGWDDDEAGSPQARRFVDAVHYQFATDRAAELAQELLSKLPERSADPSDALSALFYDRQFQEKVSDVAARMGTDREQFVQQILKPVLRNGVVQKYHGLASYGSSIGSLFHHTDAIEDETERREVADALKSYFEPTVTGAIEGAEAAADDVVRENAGNTMIVTDPSGQLAMNIAGALITSKSVTQRRYWRTSRRILVVL